MKKKSIMTGNILKKKLLYYKKITIVYKLKNI